MDILITCELDIADTAASRVRDLGLSCTARPGGFDGLLLVEAADADAVAALEKIPELTAVTPMDAACPSDLDAIVAAAVAVARDKIGGDESYAVRTTRRGKQAFSSVDANGAVGTAIWHQITKDVDLDFPDKAVYVEVVGPTTYIAVRPGTPSNKKGRAGAAGRAVTQRTAIVQQVYLDASDATTSMGHRIGRAAQAFGVKELVLAIKELSDARDLVRFVDGVLKGRETRYKKVANIQGAKAARVPVHVVDLYQVVRAREGEPFAVMTTLGAPLDEARDAIKRMYQQPRVNVLIGSHKGIPAGIGRLAATALNLSPGLTFATEHGIPAAMTGMVACLQD